MIQKGTKLRIIDNSGAKRAECIHVYNGYMRRYARIGDIIKVAIKSIKTTKKGTQKVQKGTMSKAVVVSTKNLKSFFDGHRRRTIRNFIVLISDQNKYLGNRVFCSLDSSLRSTRYLRLLTMCGGSIY